MDDTLFYKIIDEINELNLTDGIAFHVMGEPLLHPPIQTFFKYAKNIGLKLRLVSNIGMLNEGHISSFFLNNVDSFKVSLNSFDEKSFMTKKAAKKYNYNDYPH